MAEDVETLLSNAVDALPEGDLASRVRERKPLRVKLGVDPTSPDIHLGHTVVLQKLRAFQDAGHRVVLIIGDYTARVGDPSGRSKTRPALSGEEIDAHGATYHQQAMKVLRDDPELLEVRRNSEWLDMAMVDLFALARTTTVAQVLERDDFAKRLTAREPITLLELLYPLMQAYDSVAVRADVELGGTDQKFNLLLGRDVQRAYGQREQSVLTMPILVGTDGVRKMSKSLGNAIGVAEAPEELYGKVLSVPDSALKQWYALLLGGVADPALDARDAKHALARALVARFWSEADAAAAADHFQRVVVERQAPADVPGAAFAVDPSEAAGLVHLPRVLADVFGVSRSEARRMIAQGGVRLDDVVAGDLDVRPDALDGAVLRAGKRRFARLHRSP